MDIRAAMDRIVYVLHVCRKPSSEELAKDFKIIVIGTLLIGLIGFVVYAIFRVSGLT